MSILINVKKLISFDSSYETIKDTYQLEKSFKLGEESISISKPVSVELTLVRIRSGIHLEGKINTELRMICSRCLKEFDYPLELRVNEIFAISKKEKYFEDYEEVFTVNPDETIDIEPAIIENLLVNVPMKPLCRKDCKGICYMCGTNLNQKECSCSKEKIDPRLEPLKKLRDSM